jgi:hypothetical protein
MVKLARLCRMPRLAKLINVNRFKSILKSFEKDQGDDKIIMKQYKILFVYKMVRLFLISLIITYFLGCSWYVLSKYQRTLFGNFKNIDVIWYEEFGIEDMSMLYQLTTSCYFALTTLSTVGYGDLFPVS